MEIWELHQMTTVKSFSIQILLVAPQRQEVQRVIKQEISRNNLLLEKRSEIAHDFFG